MQVSENVHAIRIPFKVIVAPDKAVDRFVYAYIIAGREPIIIDTGVAGSEELILDYLRDLGHNPEALSTSILTHSHPDHIGGAKIIGEKTGCAFMAHEAEMAWIEDVDLQVEERPVPGFHSLVSGSVKVMRTLKDGDTFDLGDGRVLEVIHTPGHSKGSISLLLRDEGVLISGDAISLAGDIPIYEDVTALTASIRRLMGIEGVEHLLSSWDEPRDGVEAKKIMEKSLEYIGAIDEAVQKAAGGDLSLDPMELCARVLPALDLPPFLANPLLARTFTSHLKKQSG